MLDLTQTPQSVIEGLILLFALVIGHVIADYPLQSDFLATHKNRHYRPADGREQPHGLWFHCLLAHSLIHAGFVWLITGRVAFGLMELMFHFILDTAKCEKKTSFHADQLLHVMCKAIYVIAIMRGWVQ